MADIIEEKHSFSQNLEDYVLGNAIGFGSSAIVYIAQYKPLNIQVAIKTIELDRFERNQIDELRKEIMVMSLCKHENLLEILASFVNDSKLWIVTPFMGVGSTLDLLKCYFKEGMEEKYIQVILYQALLGLDYLHKNGHIHRDVKAGNLLISSDGVLKLADFGVSSSLMEDAGERSGSLRKTFVGTPCWMAPEVMEMTCGYNNKADIWSFGITALELSYGSAPLSKYPPMKVIYMTLSNAAPSSLDRERTRFRYSKALKSLVDECLQRDPSKRPSAEMLLKHAFFKTARKNWSSSKPSAVVIDKNMTIITGGSSLLRDLVAGVPDIVHRTSTGLKDAANPENPNIIVSSSSSLEEDLSDDDISHSPRHSSKIKQKTSPSTAVVGDYPKSLVSSSSWDFDSDDEETAVPQQSGVDSALEALTISENLNIGTSGTEPIKKGRFHVTEESPHAGDSRQSPTEELKTEIEGKKGRFEVKDLPVQSSSEEPPCTMLSTSLASSTHDDYLSSSVTEEVRIPGRTLEAKRGSRFTVTTSLPSSSLISSVVDIETGSNHSGISANMSNQKVTRIEALNLVRKLETLINSLYQEIEDLNEQCLVKP